MQPNRPHSPGCSGSTEQLFSRWLDGTRSSPSEIDCPVCRDEVGAIEHLDRILGHSLRAAAETLPPLSPERLANTLAQVQIEPPQARLTRRLRRGMRVALWTTFYALFLLSASWLAVLLFRAVATRGLLD